MLSARRGMKRGYGRARAYRPAFGRFEELPSDRWSGKQAAFRRWTRDDHPRTERRLRWQPALTSLRPYFAPLNRPARVLRMKRQETGRPAHTA